MIIKKTRIHNIELYLPESLKGKSLIIGTLLSDKEESFLIDLGFERFKLGETVLPKPIGPVSRFNSDGKYKIHRDMKMETKYRQAEWTWKEWNGRNDSVTRSKIVDIPYKRYPRSLIKPPSIELHIAQGSNDVKVICTSALTYSDATREDIKHRVNLYLELFGECIVLDSTMDGISIPKVIRVNWTIFPKGERPWDQVKEDLSAVITRLTPMKQRIAYTRLEVIERFRPDFVAIGKGGFHGYLIFGFERKSLYLFESVYIGNATYVFDKSWESLSLLTKAEILNENLQKYRLVHRGDWDEQVKSVLS